ncbi:acetyl-CoA carboxylase, biotin carboxyl carrier protein [candidate division KSB1 bacterium 4484_188]|nr:MAG: acetyl-CoA carboxylase, biotin carboxyl carrier protein [candidate division KSB1 bacterium 4484_188]HFE65116.1 acetyl-CoA carboxylase biotin carboxyl carrier protein [Caldithrix sp.]
MNFQEIKQLIKVIEKSNVGEVEIVEDTFKIRVSKNSSYSVVQQTVPAATPPAASLIQSMPTPTMEAPAAAPAAPAEKPLEKFGDNVVEVNSPMVGTFYRAPAPDADPYVQVGDTVKVGQTLCIIEAMKLMNEIQSEVNGKVVKIMVENAQPVEYDQVLFLIEKE